MTSPYSFFERPASIEPQEPAPPEHTPHSEAAFQQSPPPSSLASEPFRAKAPGSKATAFAISTALHAALALGLLLHPIGRSFGAFGSDIGSGIPVALVAGFATGGPDVGPREWETTEAESEPKQSQQEDELVGVVGEAKATPKSAEPVRVEDSQPRTALAPGPLGEAANAFEGREGASDTTGGDPTATSDLLAQIARCLPPGERPRLMFSQLTLAIGADGRLRAAPQVSSAIPLAGASDRRVADRVVQAALLCGPYSHPDVLDRSVVLPVDFSRTEAEPLHSARVD